MKTTYTRQELTRSIHAGRKECVLCNNTGSELTTILHMDECPMADRTQVSITVKTVTNPVEFTTYKHYRWSWWSASGAHYHVEVRGDELVLVLDGVDDSIIHSTPVSLAALLGWIEKNQGVL